ncbi:Response regulator protein TodT [Poriferisphaera corsica]|uniref:Response regulator protein TodT n=1 Tax=Poriferisphaera corsica TaxID=2528020 RepID=A0A517YXZ7_9BACT|nr:response regulator [Poriferisphaera corsica]QDU35104.1 Response regulator protein TodT [Poriferisphaera corsica]
MLNEQVNIKNSVALIDDDLQVCDAIESMLKSIGLQAAVFNNGNDFLKSQNLDSFGCLIVDLRLPDLSGLQVIEKAHLMYPYCPPTIMISGYADVPTAVTAIKNGIIDFLEKPFIPQDLIDQIQKALIFDQQNRSIHKLRARLDSGLDKLTIRERQVLRNLLDCKSNKQISSELKLSSKTIASHRANILSKCNTESLLQLASQIQACELNI